MNPTQAQIEAAAKAIHETRFGEGHPNECKPCLILAEAALTAAAEVGKQPMYSPSPSDLLRHLQIEKEAIAAPIERCAQELEKAYAECATLNLLHGAARIRALKEDH